jgi:hypothetical protein
MLQLSSLRSAHRRRLRWLVLPGVALVALGGCGGEQVANSSADEHWYALYMGGVRCGRMHHRSEQQQEAGRQVVHVQQELYSSIRRYGQPFDMDLKLRSVERLDGQLLRFDLGGTLGSQTIQLSGQVTDGQLRVEGTGSPLAIPWDDKTGGFLAVEQSLERQPMQPGEKRSLRKLEWAPPLAVTVTTVELAAADYEKVRIRDADVDLLRIAESVVADGEKVANMRWTDEQGRTVKLLMPGARQELVKCAKTEALKPLDEGRYDAGLALSVPVRDVPQALPAARRARYRVQVRQLDPAKVFASDASQQVREIDARTVGVVVRTIRPDTPGVSDDARPSQQDSSPNNQIESNDEVIVQLARSVAPQERDPWKLALALEKLVKESMKPGSYSKVWSTAAEVARTLEGDCTEHGVLLAALVRARGIPARVALGLIYDDGRKAFAFHLWTEVFVAGRWVGLDATRGQGGITAAYLKLSDTNLAGPNGGLASLMHVAQVLGEFEKLEVLEAE